MEDFYPCNSSQIWILNCLSNRQKSIYLGIAMYFIFLFYHFVVSFMEMMIHVCITCLNLWETDQEF